MTALRKSHRHPYVKASLYKRAEGTRSAKGDALSSQGYLTKRHFLLETEIEFKIVKPGDRGFDPL
jgi:hypothetical protein